MAQMKTKLNTSLLILLGCATWLLTGCENPDDNRAMRNTGIGAATGAVIGGVVGHQSSEAAAGAAIGAAVGGAGGYGYSKATEDDK